jgi:hypothetical protein
MARKDPVSHLARFPHGAPERLVDEILALGEAAIPLLEQAIDAQGPAAAPALVVYARLAGARALPRLIRAIATGPLTGPMFDLAAAALTSVDDAGAVSRALLACEVPPDREDFVLHLLAMAGVPSPERTERIRRALRADVVQGASLAAVAGEVALVPELREAFDALTFHVRMTPDDVRVPLALAEALATLDADGSVARLARFKAALQLSVATHEADLSALGRR